MMWPVKGGRELTPKRDDHHYFRLLEYDTIIGMVAEHAASTPGRERVTSLRPRFDLEEVQRELSATLEGMDLLRWKGAVSLAGVRDIRPSLRRARIGGVLEGEELIAIADTLAAGRKVCGQIADIEEEEAPLPYLRSLADRFEGIKSLEDAIRRCVDEQGVVLDRASSSLARVRRSIERVQQQVRNISEQMLRNPHYQKMIQEPIITVRNDRYVIPVKQEYRGAFGGIVHDQSASGATLFIEPEAVVQLNNRLRELHLEEEREVERILKELSARVGDAVDALTINIEVLAEIDLILAKARFGRQIRGVVPVIDRDVSIRLKRARHPLIPSDEVVPIDVELGDPHRVMVITGPNTGGKTVSLKTVGLLALMAHTGLPIPAEEGSRFPLLSGVFADIGDEQSIEQSLSTFSSHLTHIIRILKAVDGRSLVLLDELGAGTDPSEGAALAVGILDYLLERGCLVVATTHFSELKVFAHARPGVINASVEFDVDTLRPTYRLLVGIPGKSNAFAIADRLGLPPEIIDRAKAQLSDDENRLEEMIAALTADRRAAEEERKQAEQLRREAESLHADLKKKMEDWEEAKGRLLESARREARSVVHRAEREAEALLRQLREWARRRPDQLKEHQLIEAKKRLEDVVPEMTLPTRSPETGDPKRQLKVGDQVLVRTLNQKGEILEDLGAGEYQVQVGSLKMKVGRNDLVWVQSGEPVREPSPKKATSVRRTSEDVRPELDLRGKMVEEAIFAIDKYLDRAILAGYREVYLIHGKGTGALRAGVQQFLRNHPRVKRYRLGGHGEGGSGVTVVEL